MLWVALPHPNKVEHLLPLNVAVDSTKRVLNILLRACSTWPYLQAVRRALTSGGAHSCVTRVFADLYQLTLVRVSRSLCYGCAMTSDAGVSCEMAGAFRFYFTGAVPPPLQAWHQGVLFRYTNESLYRRGRRCIVRTYIRVTLVLTTPSRNPRSPLAHSPLCRYTSFDTNGNSAALLHWIGRTVDSGTSIWTLITGSGHTASCYCDGWPVNGAGRAIAQSWFAGQYPKKDAALRAVCWPANQPGPDWDAPAPPPPPPSVAPAAPATTGDFQRLEWMLHSLVQTVQGTAAQAATTDERFAALRSEIDEQTKLREERAKVTENYVHDLTTYNQQSMMEQMDVRLVEHAHEQSVHLEARCASAESHARELRSLTESYVDERSKLTQEAVEVKLQETTSTLQTEIHVATTGLKDRMEQRLGEATSELQVQMEQRFDAAQTELRACVLLDMWLMSDLYKNASRALENGRLQGALCDAVMKRSLEDCDGVADSKRRRVEGLAPAESDEQAPWRSNRKPVVDGVPVEPSTVQYL